MEIKVGQKIRGCEIVWVSDDKRVFGVSTPDDLGSKGVIWGKMFFQDLIMKERQELFDAGVQMLQFNDVWYTVLERCADYAQIFSRCNRITTDPASAYAHPDPDIVLAREE